MQLVVFQGFDVMPDRSRNSLINQDLSLSKGFFGVYSALRGNNGFHSMVCQDLRSPDPGSSLGSNMPVIQKFLFP